MNGARWRQSSRITKTRERAIPMRDSNVSTMKLGYHHRRLLQHLLDHPDFAHGLHTQQVHRKSESLIKMGYIDESWRVTEAGKRAPPRRTAFVAAQFPTRVLCPGEGSADRHPSGQPPKCYPQSGHQACCNRAGKPPHGPQLNKPTRHGTTRLRKLRHDSLNSNADPKGWGR
jgi:hypothetical protein